MLIWVQKTYVYFLTYTLHLTGPVGFGPTITDLEGRCLIQTRPRALIVNRDT